jgi:hypothetical protein
MLDFVKKLFGISKTKETTVVDKEVVIDAIDLNPTTTKIDGIGHETVKAAKKAPAKPKAPKAEKTTTAKPKKAKPAK